MQRTSIVAAIAAIAVFASPAAASDWKWSITPYIWATELNADIAVNDQQVASADVSFGDLLDKTDLALMIHFDGQKESHGLLLDLFYCALSDDGGTAPLPTPPGGTATAGAEFDLTLFDAAGIYNPRGDGEGVALLYGVRVLDHSTDIDATFDIGPGTVVTRSYDAGDTLVDALVGVRYIGRFSPRFHYNLRADVSGGGTKFTWNAMAGIGYSFGKSDRYALLAGYRYMDIDFDTEQDIPTVNVDVAMSGAIVGFRFSF